MTFKNQNTKKHSIPPPNRWRDRTGQPRTRNLFQNLLLQQPRNMETTQSPHGVQPQSEGSLHHKTDPALPHDGV